MIRFTPEWESAGSGLFGKPTCISCKGAKFNEWVEKGGYDVYYDRYNEKYAVATQEQDVWSCDTCHSDVTDPQGSVGSQISTLGLFGGSLEKASTPILPFALSAITVSARTIICPGSLLTNPGKTLPLINRNLNAILRQSITVDRGLILVSGRRREAF